VRSKFFLFGFLAVAALAGWRFELAERAAAADARRDEPKSSAAPPGMVWIPGGQFSMGGPSATCAACQMVIQDSTGPVCKELKEGFPDAQPVHQVIVSPFWMDATDVTNEQFERFVDATGYVTVAERRPSPEDFPGVPLERLVPGAAVFAPPDHPVELTDATAWWRYVPGANWRHPLGPESTIVGRGNYPVVQVAYQDAQSYAKWAGKRLPTEAQWEFAARGGLAGQPFPWGSEFRPNGKWMANTFQGGFPDSDTGEDGFVGIAPVAQYPPNGYGLYDMAGNVWQWCHDWYRPDYYATLARSVAINPQGPGDSFDPDEPGVAKRVQRGGSFLCSDQYCARFRLGTRGKNEPDSGSNHAGFRCVRDP
jgi:formylglycine-generating enzyme